MVTILGLGYTGRALARRLLTRGVPVIAAVRDAGRFADLRAAGLECVEFGSGSIPAGERMFYSIPPLGSADSEKMFDFVRRIAPARIVYISSTAVYGARTIVDENTPAAPDDERGRARLEGEKQIAAGQWSTLILRAAGIYGPDRGVHMAIREGRLPRSSGSGVVSRIHVEDLAALADAGLFAELEGAWPVADDYPCSSAEVAAWCVKRFGIAGDAAPLPEIRIAGRRVDGQKIRELLGVRLEYPDYQAGLMPPEPLVRR